MIIGDAIKVLKAGETLKNPATWKKGQQLTNTVGGLVIGVVALINWKFPDANIPVWISDYAIELISGTLVAVNMYLTAGTTDKISVTGKATG